jgi:hypothetical protein
MVTSYPSAHSPESSAVMNQSLYSEPRMTGGSAIPVTTSGYNAAIAYATPGHDATIPFTVPDPNPTVPIATAGYTIATPVATSGHHPAIPATTPGHNTIIPGPIDDSPPVYRDEDEAQIQSQRIRAEEAERARRYDALIADFCASNRDLISPALERKLHAARYLPEDNPSDVPAEYWHTTYGVEFFELRRLQTAYERLVSNLRDQPKTNLSCLFSRNVATQALINMPEKALPKAALSAREKTLYPSQQAGRP